MYVVWQHTQSWWHIKSAAHFPEHPIVLSDKCYEGTTNIVPGSSKSNKVRWSNIAQLKFIFLTTVWTVTLVIYSIITLTFILMVKGSL